MEFGKEYNMRTVIEENIVTNPHEAKVKQRSIASTTAVDSTSTKLPVPLTTKAVVRTSESRQLATVKVEFGGITMHVKKPTPAQVRARIAEGEEALAQLSKVLSKPGVKLELSKEHPIYVADKRDPSLVIQKIGNISRRGRFSASGRFVEVK